MREMKSVRKRTRKDNDDIKATYEKKNDADTAKAKVKKLADKELFSVNINKAGLVEKRQKLAADRFKSKNTKKMSINEINLVKRHKQTIQNKKDHKQVEKKSEDQFGDLWANQTKDNKWVKKFKAFSRGGNAAYEKAAMPQVKAIITPHEGQSYNPRANKHKEILSQVLKEEVKEIETNKKGEQQQKDSFEQMLANIRKQKNKADGNSSDEDDQQSQSSDEEDAEHDIDSNLAVGKVVDRTKKKTKSKLNSLELHKERERGLVEKRHAKKMDRQFEIMDTLQRHEADTAKRERKAEIERNKAIEKERNLQEHVGVINKPAVVGRFKYKMRKTDFQLESELAPSFRQIKAQGTDDLMRERFDDIFRRNLIELDAPTVAEKKRQIKRSFKFRDRKTGVNATLSEKMAKKNKKLKQKNDEKASNNWLNSDMILI